MRVLVACEYSGRVRNAFRARGHDAWSCDLLPAEDGSTYHMQCDIRSVMDNYWHLVIAHPPCTYLTNSGERWLKGNPERAVLRQESVDFVRWIAGLPFAKIVVENPIGHLSTALRKPAQIIQPWQFGHPETKATCLWLKGLPNLVPTNDVSAHMKTLSTAERNRVHYMPPGPDRWKERSRTYQGVADAMAAQWG